MEAKSILFKNVLPPQFNSWIDLYTRMDLAQIVKASFNEPKFGKLNFEVKDGIKNNGIIYFGVKMELDVEFLKARLFEEILDNLVLDRSFSNWIKNIKMINPEIVPYDEKLLEGYISNLTRLASLKYMEQ